MNADNGVGIGQNGDAMPGGSFDLQREKEAFDRLVGSLMRGIAQTRESGANGDLLLTVKRLHEYADKAYCSQDGDGLDRVFEDLKKIRLY